MARMTPKVVFDAGQERTLRVALEAAYGPAMPQLVTLVGSWRSEPRTSERQASERRVRRASAYQANQLAKASSELIAVLKTAEPHLADAIARCWLPTLATRELGDREQIGKLAPVEARNLVTFWRRAALGILRASRHWHGIATSESWQSPGRKITDRRELAVEVCRVLRDAGMSPERTRGRAWPLLTGGCIGPIAKTLAVVYAAADIPAPTDLRRDATQALYTIFPRKKRG